jgi:hypothetical protein
MHQEIRTIQQFYALMQETGEVRRRIVSSILEGGKPDPGDTKRLASSLEALKQIPRKDGRFELSAGATGGGTAGGGRTSTRGSDGRRTSTRGSGGRTIHLELDYEFDELEKDLLFLKEGEEALLARMSRLHPGFQEELDGALAFCRGMNLPLSCLLTDRDGTVNNYCGRYLSSIQSAYNAVFLSRFAAAAVRKAVILTSAPLSDGGLEDLTVSPPGAFVLAGSKGREYLDDRGRRGALAIGTDKQRQLERLNRRLGELLRDPGYEIFALIGSGLQFKFGQTTVARQDIYGSIPEADSINFAGVIRELICEIDPDGLYFRIEDTGKDIEIILTVEGASGLKDFDKGDGILFLDSRLGLGLRRGANLVCGDTASDVPMVAAAAEKSPDPWTIFVTREEKLKEAVRRTSKRAHFVSKPDVLVCLLNQLGKERG